MPLDPARFHLINRVVMPLGRVGPGGLNLIGSAFFTSVPGKLATAAHTIGQDDANLQVVLPRTNSILEYQDTTDTQVRFTKATVVAHDPFRDICILKVDGDARANYPMGGADDIQVGSQTVSFGFPHSPQGRLVLTYQAAEVGAKILIGAGGITSKHIVLNTQARPGQSGSPIFRLEDLRLVAMLLGSYAPGGGGGISLGGIDPQTLHQTTHAVSAEYIGAML